MHLSMPCPNCNWYFPFLGVNYPHSRAIYDHVKWPHTKDTTIETIKSALLYWNFKPTKGINQTKIIMISKAVLLKEEETEET